MPRGEHLKTHGLSKTRTYFVWKGMRARCRKHPRYAGRGITVCPEWNASYPQFLADMGEAPEGMTLERIDNDGPYAPWNCKWATWNENTNNRSNKRRYDYKGAEYTLKQLCEMTGLSKTTLHMRLHNYGWSVEDAVEVPRYHRRSSYQS